MKFLHPDLADDTEILSTPPASAARGRADALEEAAFASGAALASLQGVLRRDDVPRSLLRERLALNAAEACVALSGRAERAGELRDAAHLLRPGDQPGPAGETYLQWRRAVERPISVTALRRALPILAQDDISAWLDAEQGTPPARAASVLGAVLSDRPRAETAALILADAALARALGWDHVLPLLAAGLKPRDLRLGGEALRLACHRAAAASAAEATRLALDLDRRAAHLKSVAPKLRAKGAAEAIKLFLTRDAAAPAALTGLMSDRAARRLCDRLIYLGVVRELTGRDAFRLYGL